MQQGSWNWGYWSARDARTSVQSSLRRFTSKLFSPILRYQISCEGYQPSHAGSQLHEPDRQQVSFQNQQFFLRRYLLFNPFSHQLVKKAFYVCSRIDSHITASPFLRNTTNEQLFWTYSHIESRTQSQGSALYTRTQRWKLKVILLRRTGGMIVHEIGQAPKKALKAPKDKQRLRAHTPKVRTGCITCK